MNFNNLKNPYIIAEIGVNHEGDESKAIDLIQKAKNCGADAVKFQMFNTKKYISDDAFYASYMKKGLISKKEKIDEKNFNYKWPKFEFTW